MIRGISSLPGWTCNCKRLGVGGCRPALSLLRDALLDVLPGLADGPRAAYGEELLPRMCT